MTDTHYNTICECHCLASSEYPNKDHNDLMKAVREYIYDKKICYSPNTHENTRLYYGDFKHDDEYFYFRLIEV